MARAFNFADYECVPDLAESRFLDGFTDQVLEYLDSAPVCNPVPPSQDGRKAVELSEPLMPSFSGYEAGSG